MDLCVIPPSTIFFKSIIFRNYFHWNEHIENMSGTVQSPINYFGIELRILPIIVHSPFLEPAQHKVPDFYIQKLNIKFNSPFHFVNADICTYFCIIFHAILLLVLDAEVDIMWCILQNCLWKRWQKFNLHHIGPTISPVRRREPKVKHSVFLALQDSSWENHLVFISQGSLG